MKKTTKISLFVILCMGLSQANYAQTLKPEETFVKNFYQLYIQKLVANKLMTDATLKKYFTDSFFKKVKRTTDADIVINAQDFDDAWVKNITTKRIEGKGPTTIAVFLKGKDFNQNLKVLLIPSGNGYKISDVLPSN